MTEQLATSLPEPVSSLTITLTVNGAVRQLETEVRRSLADVLRDELSMTATHLGCEHGVCGACTVLVDNVPVRSCLMLAATADGSNVTTAEGGEQDPVVAKVQQVIVDEDALQCGFCTPGFVMLLAGLLHSGFDGDEEEVAEVLSSNICRCTGYQGLIRAAQALLLDDLGRAG